MEVTVSFTRQQCMKDSTGKAIKDSTGKNVLLDTPQHVPHVKDAIQAKLDDNNGVMIFARVAEDELSAVNAAVTRLSNGKLQLYPSKNVTRKDSYVLGNARVVALQTSYE